MITTFAASTAIGTVWTWYVIRSAGVIAVVLMVLAMLSGIGMVTGLTYRLLEPLKAWIVHRAISIALSLSVLLHVGFLLIDKYKAYSLANVLIPFNVQYEHARILGIGVGSFYNALGIIGFYMAILVVLSSLFFIESKKRLWKWLHYLSYPLMISVFFHALYLGTDFQHGLVRTVWLLFGVVLLIGIVSRLRRVGTVRGE